MKHQRGDAGGGYSEILSNFASRFYVAADGPSSPKHRPEQRPGSAYDVRKRTQARQPPGAEREAAEGQNQKKNKKQNALSFSACITAQQKALARQRRKARPHESA